jgi:hypothetical protein
LIDGFDFRSALGIGVLIETAHSPEDPSNFDVYFAKMTIQLGFLEPIEWTSETQNDFSISRLGGLPVHIYTQVSHG